MSAHDQYPTDVAGDLPPLPIPRPGEWSPARPAPSEVATPRSLGGGASLTAASTDQADVVPLPEPEPSTAADMDRLPWQLAAELTAGMLANPARSHASVKDAMGLFDQFLHELHAYARMAAEHDLHAPGSQPKRGHTDYFQRYGAEEAASAAEPTRAPGTTPPHVPKPAPTQPRPAGSYLPIPPATRPYAPSAMAPLPVDPAEIDPGSSHTA